MIYNQRHMPRYRFACTCGNFEFVDEDRKKVIEAAKKHAQTCSDLQGADDIALDAMIELM